MNNEFRASTLSFTVNLKRTPTLRTNARFDNFEARNGIKKRVILEITQCDEYLRCSPSKLLPFVDSDAGVLE